MICGESRRSWAELERQTAHVAQVLRVHGVAHQDRVGIYLHKSIESLVAVHGVLRSGAAYVPLDPLAPASITASILDECEISVIVSHELAAPRLIGVLNEWADQPNDQPSSRALTVVGVAPDQLGRSHDGARVADLHRQERLTCVDWGEVAGYGRIQPQSIDPDGLAYIMYTSGSTGRPKGISHTHRSGLAYAKAAANLYGLRPQDRMASLSPLHFDMSTLEFFAGVSVGATIVLVPEPYLKIPASLSQLLSEQRCTTLYTVPSLFQQLLHRGVLESRDLSAVRWVLPAGEVFPLEPLRQLVKLLPQARFSNIYGPAEVNQCSYYNFGFEAGLPADGMLPIGQPWDAAEFLIVDENDQTVKPGERGLLLVSSTTMMSGYWKRPDLDALAFVELPNQSGEMVRWYRTGDVVARREDEHLVFFGRHDHQVKIRGHRVELETVESAVSDLPGIAQVVVGPRPNPTGDTELVAVYQPASDDGQLASEAKQIEWRRALSHTLPPYAVPAQFLLIESFPTTASGKINRQMVRKQLGALPVD